MITFWGKISTNTYIEFLFFCIRPWLRTELYLCCINGIANGDRMDKYKVSFMCIMFNFCV